MPRFIQDCYFTKQEDCLLAVEGVLLEADSAADAIHRYRNGETCFWDSWRGSFAGLLLDQRSETLLVFNDHIGSKMLFYTHTQNGVVFASDLRALAQAVGLKDCDNGFVRDILEEGCTYTEKTVLSGIQRLMAGHYLCIRGSELQAVSYHLFDNTPWPYDESAMIHETDRLFRQAVTRVIKKNEQLGLQHFFPLSGGLDSRMAQWVARQIASRPIINFTYSQSGHYDHLLPQQISKALGNVWQFFPLDGGAYLTNIDSTTGQTEWLVNYMGPIEIVTFAQQQDWRQKGVVLTGINGDNIFATETDWMHEMSRIYRQGFNGNSLGSPLVFQHYTESYSPFCDVDVLDYVLHIPTAKRRNYAFYDRWILTCYPEAAQWHHKHELIGHRHLMITVAGRNIPLRDLPQRILYSILRRLHIYEGHRMQGDSMHPYEDWVRQNPKIYDELYDYFRNHRHLLKGHSFDSSCVQKMRAGTIMEKGKVLTILSALKAFSDIGEPA